MVLRNSSYCIIRARLLCGSFLWESYDARIRLLDCASLRYRTIIGVFMLNFIQHFYFHFYYLPIQMFGIVVYDLTTSTAFNMPTSPLLSQYYRILHLAAQGSLCFYCMPWMILGFGLMIRVGQKGHNSIIADMIVWKDFVGQAFGALETAQTLVLAVSSKRQDIPIVLFLLSAERMFHYVKTLSGPKYLM